MSGQLSSVKKRKAEQRGRNAEMLAALLLRIKGYSILEQRYRCVAGEVDIIARKGSLFIFVEVKARNRKTDALESISPTQRRRIEAAAEVWLGSQPSREFAVRFDVITVAPRQLPSHMRDAWRDGE